MPKCVPMTRSSELRPLTLLLYVVPVTLMELLRRWGSGATSGSGGGGGGGGGGGTGTNTHIGNAEEEVKVYEGLQRLSWSEPVNWSKIRNDSVHLTHKPLFTHAHTDLKTGAWTRGIQKDKCAHTPGALYPRNREILLWQCSCSSYVSSWYTNCQITCLAGVSSTGNTSTIRVSTFLLPWKHRQGDRDRLAVQSEVKVELVGMITHVCRKLHYIYLAETFIQSDLQ